MLSYEHGITTKALYLSKGWSQTKWQRAKFSPNPPCELMEELTALLGLPPGAEFLLLHGKPEEVVTAPVVYSNAMWERLT